MAEDAIAKLKVSIEADVAKYKAALAQAASLTKVHTQAVEAELKKEQTRFEKIRESINKVQVAMGRKVETKAFTDIKKQLADAQGELTGLTAKMDELKKSGGMTEHTKEYQKLTEQLSAAESKLDDLEAKQQKLSKSGNDYVLSEYYTNLLQKIRATEKEVEGLSKKLAEARERLALAEQNGGNAIEPTNAINRYTTQLARMQRILDMYREHQKNAQDNHLALEPTPEMRKLSVEAKDARTKVEQLNAAMEELRQSGKDTQETATWIKMEEQAGDLGARIGELIERKQELASSGQAVESVTRRENESFRAMKTLIAAIKVSLSGLSKGFSTMLTGIRKASGAFASLIQRFATGIPRLKLFSSEVKKSSGALDGAKGIVKNLLRYGLGIRGLFALFNKVRGAIKEGLDNLAQYDKAGQLNQSLTTLHSSLIQLKNSLASAFAPVLVAITPALNQLIQLVIKGADAVGQLMSAITGVPYVKAKAVTEDYAESIENQGKKAKKSKKETKELERELMGFDRINKLSDDKDKDDDDDDDDDNKLSPSQMFEPGTVAAKWQALADKIKKIIKDLLDVVKKAWEANGQKVIDSFKRALERVKQLITDIAKTFYRVFTEGYGFEWLVSLFNLISKILDVIGAIALAFDRAWNDNNAGYKYVASIFTMFKSINLTLAAIARDFAKAWESPAGTKAASAILRLLTNINRTIKKISDAFRKAWNQDDIGLDIFTTLLNSLGDVLNLIADITRDFGRAFESDTGVAMLHNILIVIRNILESIGQVATAFRQVWNDNGFGLRILTSIMGMWSTIFGLIGDITRDFGRVFSDGYGRDMIRSILTLFETIHAIIGSITQAFRNAWNDNNRGYDYINSIARLISSIFRLLNSIGQAFKAAWQEGGLGEEIMGNILEIVTGIHDTISGFVEAIQRGWEAGDSGKRIWRGILKVVNTILEKFNGIVQSTKEWAENLDFGPIFEAFGKLTEKLDPIAETITGALADGWKNVLLPLGKWTIEEGLPAALEALGSALDVINSVLQTLEPAFTPLWNNVIKPLAEKTGAALIVVMQWITEKLQGLSNWISQHQEGFSKFVEVAGTFVAVWIGANTVAGIIGAITSALSGIVAMLTGAGGVVSGISLVLGSINPIMLGISAVVTGIVLLATHWDEVTAAAKAAVDAMFVPKEFTEENLPELDQLLSDLERTTDALGETASNVSQEGMTELYQSINNMRMEAVNSPYALDDFMRACQRAGVGPDELKEACDRANVNLDVLIEALGGTGDASTAMADATQEASTAVSDAISDCEASVSGSLNGVNESLDSTKGAIGEMNTATESATGDMNSALSAFSEACSSWMDSVSSSYDDAKGTVTDLKDTTSSASTDMSADMSEFNRQVESCMEDINRAVESGQEPLKGLKDATSDAKDKTGKDWEKMKKDAKDNITEASGTVNDKSGSMKKDVTESNAAINKDTAKQWEDIRLSVDTAFASIYSGSMEWVKKLRDDLYQKFETIATVLPKKFKGIDDDIGEYFMSVGDKVKEVVDEDKLPDYFKDLETNIVSRFDSTASDIGSKFNETRQLVENAVNPSQILNIFQRISDDSIAKFSNTASEIAAKFSGMSSAIQTALDPQAIGRAAEQAANYLVTPFESARTQIDNVFRNFNPFDLWELNNIGRRAGDELANGFRSAYIQTPHMYISGWDQHPNGSGGVINTPRFSVQWYAKGGFPQDGEMFVANENGIEAMGKMGNRNVVANNEQIVDGIRQGVLDAMLTAGERQGSGNNQPVYITLTIDGKEVSRKVIKDIRQMSKANGSPVLPS